MTTCLKHRNHREHLLAITGLITMLVAPGAFAAPYTDAETEALDRLCQIREAIIQVYEVEGQHLLSTQIDDAVALGFLAPDWETLASGYELSTTTTPSLGFLARPSAYMSDTTRSFFLDYRLRVHVGEYADAHELSPLIGNAPCPPEAADEDAALRDVATLLRMQQLFYEQFGFFAHSFDSLQVDNELLACGLGTARHGYRFYLDAEGEAFRCLAVPVSGASPAHRALYVDQSGVFRVATTGIPGPESEAYPQPNPEPNACLTQILENERNVFELMCEVFEAEELHYELNGWYVTWHLDLPVELSFDFLKTYFGYNFILGGTTDWYYVTIDRAEQSTATARSFFFSPDRNVHAAFRRDAWVVDPVIGQVCELPHPPYIGAASEVQHHSGDTDQDNRLSLTELLRIIQLYNSGIFHCDASTEDGFAPGLGYMNCEPHSADYDVRPFYIDLGELLRAIQLFSGLGYYPCTSGEDGFCGVPRG